MSEWICSDSSTKIFHPVIKKNEFCLESFILFILSAYWWIPDCWIAHMQQCQSGCLFVSIRFLRLKLTVVALQYYYSLFTFLTCAKGHREYRVFAFLYCISELFVTCSQFELADLSWCESVVGYQNGAETLFNSSRGIYLFTSSDGKYDDIFLHELRFLQSSTSARILR